MIILYGHWTIWVDKSKTEMHSIIQEGWHELVAHPRGSLQVPLATLLPVFSHNSHHLDPS